MSNLANPKIAVVFTSLLPQFVAPGRALLVPFLALGGLFAAMTAAWLCAYAVAAAGPPASSSARRSAVPWTDSPASS